MSVVGDKFKKNEFYVPEVLIAARAMHGAMDVLKPKLVEAGVEPVGKVILGTVKGDLHDIGKNLVASMLEGGGFQVILGVPDGKIVGADIALSELVEPDDAHLPDEQPTSDALSTSRETSSACRSSRLRNGTSEHGERP